MSGFQTGIVKMSATFAFKIFARKTSSGSFGELYIDSKIDTIEKLIKSILILLFFLKENSYLLASSTVAG